MGRACRGQFVTKLAPVVRFGVGSGGALRPAPAPTRMVLCHQLSNELDPHPEMPPKESRLPQPLDEDHESLRLELELKGSWPLTP